MHTSYTDICYVYVRRLIEKDLLRLFCEVTVRTSCVAPYCVDTRLKGDIYSIFASNYFVFRLEILQQAFLITVLSTVVVLRLLGYTRGLLEFLSCPEPSSTMLISFFHKDLRPILPKLSQHNGFWTEIVYMRKSEQ